MNNYSDIIKIWNLTGLRIILRMKSDCASACIQNKDTCSAFALTGSGCGLGIADFAVKVSAAAPESVKDEVYLDQAIEPGKLT